MIAVDFSSGQEIYPRLAQQLKSLDIGVLGMWSIRDRGERGIHLSMVLPPSSPLPAVNNVGLSYEHADYFLSVSEQVNYKMLNTGLYVHV